MIGGASMLYLKDWRVCTPPGFSLGFEGDNLAVTLALDTDLPEGWDLKLDVEKEGKKNIIQLERSGQVYSVQLTSSMLASGGLYLLQVRGTLGEQIRHSNQFYAAVHHSINAVDAFPPSLPSEFEQMEDRLTDINNHPPRPGANGFWQIYDPDTGEYVPSNIPLPDGGGGTGYVIGHGLKITGGTTLEVNAVNNFTGDNTLPATAALVQEQVGNIEVLLGTI